MTPERCTGLAALLLELRDWLIEERQGGLDVAIIERCVEILGEVRSELIREGAK